MNYQELNAKVKELQRLKEISEQINETMENLKNEIKAEMTLRGTDTLNGTNWKIIWKERQMTRLDKDLLEKDFGDLSKYKKVTKYKSFYLKETKGD